MRPTRPWTLSRGAIRELVIAAGILLASVIIGLAIALVVGLLRAAVSC